MKIKKQIKEKVRCPKCNIEIHHGIFCPQCGTLMGKMQWINDTYEIVYFSNIEKEEKRNEKVRLKKKQVKLGLITLSFIFSIVLLAAIFNFFSIEKEEGEEKMDKMTYSYIKESNGKYEVYGLSGNYPLLFRISENWNLVGQNEREERYLIANPISGYNYLFMDGTLNLMGDESMDYFNIGNSVMAYNSGLTALIYQNKDSYVLWKAGEKEVVIGETYEFLNRIVSVSENGRYYSCFKGHADQPNLTVVDTKSGKSTVYEVDELLVSKASKMRVYEDGSVLCLSMNRIVYFNDDKINTLGIEDASLLAAKDLETYIFVDVDGNLCKGNLKKPNQFQIVDCLIEQYFLGKVTSTDSYEIYSLDQDSNIADGKNNVIYYIKSDYLMKYDFSENKVYIIGQLDGMHVQGILESRYSYTVIDENEFCYFIPKSMSGDDYKIEKYRMSQVLSLLNLGHGAQVTYGSQMDETILTLYDGVKTVEKEVDFKVINGFSNEQTSELFFLTDQYDLIYMENFDAIPKSIGHIECEANSITAYVEGVLYYYSSGQVIGMKVPEFKEVFREDSIGIKQWITTRP